VWGWDLGLGDPGCRGEWWSGVLLDFLDKFSRDNQILPREPFCLLSSCTNKQLSRGAACIFSLIAVGVMEHYEYCAVSTKWLLL
jgi:hypothetical protein